MQQTPGFQDWCVIDWLPRTSKAVPRPNVNVQADKSVLRRETGNQRTQRLLGLLQDFGEADLMLAGCHENVFSMRCSPLSSILPGHCSSWLQASGTSGGQDVG